MSSEKARRAADKAERLVEQREAEEAARNAGVDPYKGLSPRQLAERIRRR